MFPFFYPVPTSATWAGMKRYAFRSRSSSARKLGARLWVWGVAGYVQDGAGLHLHDSSMVSNRRISYQARSTIAVLDSASILLERHPLRAYDAIHLATALGAQANRGFDESQFCLNPSDLSNQGRRRSHPVSVSCSGKLRVSSRPRPHTGETATTHSLPWPPLPR
jgi:hypothetical protein